MKVALYARVSTSDQDCAMQISELKGYAARNGWEVTGEYVDTISGAKAKRPSLDLLLADATLRRFDAVVCWKLDRWGRSLPHCLASLEELDRLGIRFIVPGQGIDTDKASPVGRLLLHVVGAVAQFERELIRERVVAGVRQAQTKGTKSGLPIGRPRRVFRRDEAARLRADGRSWAAIGRILGVPAGTVREGLRKPFPESSTQTAATAGV
jgi:DNA invertase Pin-like site-specific DNA recombinase